MHYVLSCGGKRVRPLLAMLSCGLFRDETTLCLRPALAVELFHNFTLIHDDVMDQAPLRRGHPTVHARWDVNLAILAGDSMLISGYELLCEVPSGVLAQVLARFNTSALRVCEGQQWDMDFECEKNVSEESYLQMARHKTGYLLGFCLALGALVAEAEPKYVEALQSLGEHLGLIFQLRDDWLDVYGTSQAFGKQSGGDIINNKKTYLLITAMGRASGTHLKRLNDLLTTHDIQDEEKVQSMRALYDELGVAEITQARIASFQQSCTQHLEALKLPSHRLAPLELLLNQLVNRNT